MIPVRISDNNYLVDKKQIIDLLYIVNGVNTQYCLITNLASLCRPQRTSDHTTSKYLCCRCLHFCAREESYKTHVERCWNLDAQKNVFLQRNNPMMREKVRFTQVPHQLPLPFYFVADFECILQRLNKDPASVDDSSIFEN